MAAPERAMPVGAVVVNVPPQVVEVPLATVSPVGSVSVKATPASAVDACGLVMVKVKLVVALSAMPDGLKTLAIDGGAITVTLAEAVLPVPPSVEEIALVVLFWTPAVDPLTLAAIVQELLAAIEPPFREI